MARTPEGEVKAAHKAYLKSLGAYQFWPVQTGYGKDTVDCLACVVGRFVAIETKRPGKRKGTARQELRLAEIRAAGGCAFVSDDINRSMWIIEAWCFGVIREE